MICSACCGRTKFGLSIESLLCSRISCVGDNPCIAPPEYLLWKLFLFNFSFYFYGSNEVSWDYIYIHSSITVYFWTFRVDWILIHSHILHYQSLSFIRWRINSRREYMTLTTKARTYLMVFFLYSQRRNVLHVVMLQDKYNLPFNFPLFTFFHSLINLIFFSVLFPFNPQYWISSDLMFIYRMRPTVY